MKPLGLKEILALSLHLTITLCQDYASLQTKNFDARIVSESQVLASLKPAGGTFDFLPFDLLSKRGRNGQYHWGDITFRYRQTGTTTWSKSDSAAARQPVTKISTLSSNLKPTLPGNPLNVTRSWIDVDGDVGMQFTIQNTGTSAIEIGSLGFPAEFNSIFTGRTASDMQAKCSLSDPYIGLHAGHIRVAPTRGTGAALVVTPIGDTPFEAYRNLVEQSYSDTAYGSQTFEGFYEWQVLSKAYADNEWSGKTPWNPASSRTLAAGQTVQFGLRFSLATDGVRGLDAAIQRTGTPVARGVPGYIIPRDAPAQLVIKANSTVASTDISPAGALTLVSSQAGFYTVTPSSSAWGRVRLTLTYADGKKQSIHYYITKSATDAVSDLGTFSTTAQWFTDTSDPFGRAPSVMTYDYEAKAIVKQDPRVWIAGLSDEAGAGSFLAASMKQVIRPNAGEVTKLESFVDGVLFKTIQTTDFSVRKSIFFYDQSQVPSYRYDGSFNWGNWWSWNKAAAYATDRAYDYVHVAATYWALYRVGRAYPELLKSHKWDWYLNQAYQTVVRSMKTNVGYNRVGLMGETVFGELLADLTREGLTSQASTLSSLMRDRANQWNSEEVPYGSEMAWDSTGQEGVYYWTKYFGFTNSATKTVNSVLGFMPAVPHWGWNGNARRYWDNIYGGKLQRIERQIHHYGSGLNALVLLSAFRSNPSDTYLIQVGYGGTSGPLSSINQEGFAAASFHSWPDTLKHDSYSGDFGPGFLGLALGSGTYVVQDPDLGLVAYGGSLTSSGSTATVTTRDSTRRKVFHGPLGLLISVDAGVIQSVAFATNGSGSITVTLSQLSGGPNAQSAVLWLETTSGSATYKVSTTGISQSRGGWQVPLTSGSVTVQVTKS